MLRAELRAERNYVAAAQYSHHAAVAGAPANTAGDAARTPAIFETVSNPGSIT